MHSAITSSDTRPRSWLMTTSNDSAFTLSSEDERVKALLLTEGERVKALLLLVVT
jgi:hypothetical protein